MSKPTSRTGIGASSILLILLVLSLTAFAVLTLLSARVDARLTDRTVESTAAYYAADAAAQKRIAEIDAALLAGGDPGAWNDIKKDGADPALLSFSVETGDGRAIAVQLRVLDGAGAKRYETVSYRVVNIAGWGA